MTIEFLELDKIYSNYSLFILCPILQGRQAGYYCPNQPVAKLILPASTMVQRL